MVAQLVENLPAMQETQVQPLGREDPLEESRKSSGVLLPRGSHGQRSLAGDSPWDHRALDVTERLARAQKTRVSAKPRLLLLNKVMG